MDKSWKYFCRKLASGDNLTFCARGLIGIWPTETLHFTLLVKNDNQTQEMDMPFTVLVPETAGGSV
jgi:hypothetical protein